MSETELIARDLIARCVEAAREIDNDGTASHVGLTADECRAVATALQQALAERDEANAFVAKLQGALAFWLPSVTPEIEAETGGRAGDDACLLAGFEGDVPSPAWIDTKLARLTAALSAETEARREAVEALQPFANFAVAAARFVRDRAMSGGSPIMPTNQFRLSDFERAAAVVAAAIRQRQGERS